MSTPTSAADTSNASTPGTTASLTGDPQVDGSDYRIGPLDVLEIAVYQAPDLSGTFAVSAEGQIDMPLIGTVAASGKSLSELKDEITQKLGDKYLQSPSVTVSMKDALSQRIAIEGAVNKPGVYPMTGPTTLMQVMAMAGGFDKLADERGVVVIRKVDGKRSAAKFDYRAIRNGAANDPPIFGGDIVVVDNSGFKSTWSNLKSSLGVVGFFVPFL